MQPSSGAGLQPAHHRSTLIIGALSVLLLLALIFGFWAFGGRQDYKNKSDVKVANAVAAVKTAEDASQKQLYNEELKKPYKTYSGSATFGTISFNYPLTYSAYVDSSNSSSPIEGYFHPGIVPGIQSGTAFALRVELVAAAYSQVVGQLSALSQKGGLSASAYIPAKMKSVKNVQPGTLFVGAISTDQQGAAQNGAELVIPVRDKTLQIYTQSNDYIGDFNNIVLPSLTFVP